MNFWNAREQQWTPSDPSFAATENGFVAERVQHRVRIHGDLNAVGAVTLQTLEDIVLQSTPVGVGLYDTVSGRFQLIGAITNCAGVLVSSNQVLFENAFRGSGVCADVVYTVEPAAFEQDIVFTGRLDPAVYGFPGESCQIQIWTEFYNAPQPERERRPLRVETDPVVRQRKVSPDLIDEVLRFGEQLEIGSGWAYTVPGADEPNGTVAAYWTMHSAFAQPIASCCRHKSNI